MPLTLTLPSLDAGNRLLLASAPPPGLGLPACIHPGPLPAMPAGLHLDNLGGPLFQVLGRMRWPAGGLDHVAVVLEAQAPVSGGTVELASRRAGLSLAWVTLSDKGSQGLRADESGPRIEAQARQLLPLSLCRGHLLPDDACALRALLTDLALFQGFDLILTTGGTGLGPRDITPEATMAIIDKRLPGFEQAMTLASLQKTPHGAISRAVAGTLGDSIIVNLPGSPKAVAENLAAILPALAHASDKLRGDQADCATAERR